MAKTTRKKNVKTPNRYNDYIPLALASTAQIVRELYLRDHSITEREITEQFDSKTGSRITTSKAKA